MKIKEDPLDKFKFKKGRKWPSIVGFIVLGIILLMGMCMYAEKESLEEIEGRVENFVFIAPNLAPSRVTTRACTIYKLLSYLGAEDKDRVEELANITFVTTFLNADFSTEETARELFKSQRCKENYLGE